ncbi:mCG1026012 [Mus musculus]|nr:mCG1026012 [Mus musculus]
MATGTDKVVEGPTRMRTHSMYRHEQILASRYIRAPSCIVFHHTHPISGTRDVFPKEDNIGTCQDGWVSYSY